MALLRNREVQILGRADAADASPVYIVSYANGTKENVKLTELQLTEAEYKDMLRTNGEVYMNNVQKVDDKTLQEILDSQDKEKIEARQAAERQITKEPSPVVEAKVEKKKVKEEAPVAE
jgi:hypothetical protein